ncbi:MAG: ABC transporter permease [Clostridia bacterium]|nr:ABC transporter permease [Clostridia bacterium]
MSTTMNKYDNIPAEKFQFAKKVDLAHDKKFDTKPVSYFQGAFRRFSKNKGAVVGGVVIMCLILFAIIAPFFTPFRPAYYDMMYAYVTPKNELFVKSGIDFWDGCKVKDTNYLGYLKDTALALETGRDIIKDGEYEVSEDGKNYTYRYDTYYGVGFGKYKIISQQEFEDIQRYQDETGRQILYPIVPFSERKDMLEKNKYDANIYYKVENVKSPTLRPKLNQKGEIVPNYWSYEAGNPNALMPEYNSIRIEGEDGFTKDGKQHFYAYGSKVDGGIEVRAEYYEYYIYQHTQVIKDGIEEPSFLFGTTDTGKDIFACLAYGARFSFVFATVVAAVNFIVGVIWGSISGYFGGKIDLFMERFSEILGSVPTMIVITLLKYHMGTASQALVLFIAFFATGWIGMAGRTRMQFYRFKNQEYVLAARTLGASDSRIMFKHIFPNGLGTIVTSVALVIPGMIYSETSLSYLGIINLEAGNTTSVGTLIAAGQKSIMANAGFVAFFPCAFLVLLMLSFNLFGNGLRDAFNPSLRGSED